jgi:hypothetical protein
LCLIVIQTKSRYNYPDSQITSKDVDETSLRSSINDPFQKSHQFYLLNEKFDTTLDNWTKTGDILWGISSGNLRMNGDDNGGFENGWVTLIDMLPPFRYGFLSLYYEFVEYQLFPDSAFQIDIGYDGFWQTIASGYEDESGWINLDLSSYDTNHSNFKIRFGLIAEDSSEYLEIDDITLTVYEFMVQESSGDPINSTLIGQYLQGVINPHFLSYSDWNQQEVWIQYDANNPTLTGAPWVKCTNNLFGNFSRIISRSEYNHMDTLYYRYRTQNQDNSSQRYSNIFSFYVIDGDPPDITGPTDGNYSSAVYYNNVSIVFLINDSTNIGGSGIKSIVMYCRNGSEAQLGDPEVDPNGTVGTDREYEFVIPSWYLNSSQDLHYKIVAIDNNDNEGVETGSFSVDDDRSPEVLYKGASVDPVEYNESIFFYYDITEPATASGLQDVELRIKTGTLAEKPSGPGDYDQSVSPLTPVNNSGGGFIFEVGEQYFDWSADVFAWCFVYAEDKNNNVNTSDVIPVQINVTDSYAPIVVADSDNGINCSYNADKILIFEVTEPVGASGINSDLFCLYYKINDPSLSNPIKINRTIDKWHEIITFTIDDAGLSLHDIIYFRLNFTDNAGNPYDSGILNFGVWDFEDPTLSLNAINDTGNDGVVMYYEDLEIKYEISEDDYGIGFDPNPSTLKFYYKIGSPPSSPSDYSKILYPSENIARRGGIYSIVINHDDYVYGEYIYYWVNVSDIYGNHEDTYGNIRYFNISNVYTAIVSAPSGYINYKSVNISLITNLACDIWYVLNGTNTSTPIFTNFYSEIIELDSDGKYNFVFYAYDSRSEHATGISFTLDTQPTGKVTLTYTLVGPIVELHWDVPSGVDSRTYYRIYKSTEPDFELSEDTLVYIWHPDDEGRIKTYGHDLIFIDKETTAGSLYYYKIVAIDRAENVSEGSDLLTVSIPTDPMVIFIIIVAIIAAAAVSGFFVIQKIRFRKVGPFYTDKELGIDDKIVFPEKEIKPTIKQKWDTIKTIKPKSVPSIAPPIMNKTMYWNSELAKLIQEGYEFESKGKYLEAIKTYQILVRISNRINGSDLAQVFQEKILTIYNKA